LQSQNSKPSTQNLIPLPNHLQHFTLSQNIDAIRMPPSRYCALIERASAGRRRRLASLAHDFVICHHSSSALDRSVGHRHLARFGPAVAARRGDGTVDGRRVCATAELCTDHNVCMAATCLAASARVAGSHDGLDCGGMFLGCRTARWDRGSSRHCAGCSTAGRRIDIAPSPGTTGILERTSDRSRIPVNHTPEPHARRCRSLAAPGECPAANEATSRGPAVARETRRTVRFSRLGRRGSARTSQDSAPGTRTSKQARDNLVQGGVKQKQSENITKQRTNR
jgi:hypothetical protein